MANRIIITDYWTGEKVQQITIKSSGSVSFKVEDIRGKRMMVIRDYWTNEVIQKATIKSQSSIQYSCR